MNRAFSRRQEYRDAIAVAADSLLDAWDTLAIVDAAQDFARVLNETLEDNERKLLTGREGRNGLITGTGYALSPYKAWQCIDSEPIRTQMFIAEIRDKVDSALRDSSGPVRLLYAGTGPYAPLILSSLHRYTPDQLQVTAIDINDLSVGILESTLCKLGYTDFFEGVMAFDATEIDLEREGVDPNFDLFVTETMNAGLTDEPQYAISRNIVPQLPHKAVLVPDTVYIDLHGVKSSNSFVHTPIGNVVKLSADTARDLSYNYVTRFLGEGVGAFSYYLMTTTVCVGKSRVLLPNSSIITRDMSLRSSRVPKKRHSNGVGLEYYPGIHKESVYVRT